MIPIRDNVPARRMPVVTYALIIANAWVFLRETGSSAAEVEQFVHLWGVIPARLLGPSPGGLGVFPPHAWMTFFSYMFIHGGWLHLISNMWALWLFGDNVEDRLGHLRYAAFYVMCGLAAVALHCLLHPRSTVPTVGASGAIAGVMGAYFLFFPRSRVIAVIPIFFYPFFVELPTAVYLLVWVGSQLLSGTLTLLSGSSELAGVAFWAHVGGFACGMVLGRWWCQHPRGRHRCYWERDEYRPW